jgi:anaerobic selenocysteine-containing dehydrogenase
MRVRYRDLLQDSGMSTANTPSQTSARIEQKNTTCYMCACRCGIRVTLRDNEVRYIEGTRSTRV